MYKKEEIEFLLDKEDTVGAYEEKGQHDQGQGPSVLEQEQMMLSSMDHVQKIEMIQGERAIIKVIEMIQGKRVSIKVILRQYDAFQYGLCAEDWNWLN